MLVDQLTPHINLWIEHDGKVVLSLWRVQLLQAIDQAGSINAAAKLMGIQYRLAWERLGEMEAGLGLELVERRIGGAHGGGTRLTETARNLVERFETLASEVDVQLDEQFHQTFG